MWVRGLFALAVATQVVAATPAETPSLEAEACKASRLIALQQKYPAVKDVVIDLDSAKIIKTDTKIAEVPVRTVIIGDAYIERTKGTKPQTLVCIIAEKGKVLLTLFTDQ